MFMFECLYCIYIYIYLNDIENKKHKKIFVILSVFYHLPSTICRKSVEICIKNNL